MPVVRLTAKERILIHLADYAKYADVVEVPPDMGQEGIAQAAGIHVQHVRQFLDPLLKEGLVRERTAHVRGHRRRLRVYDLTDSGRLAASRLRERVRGEAIRVRDEHGVRETTVGELLRETSGKIPIAPVVRGAMNAEVMDLLSLRTGPEAALIARLGEAPRLGPFAGRGPELAALTQQGDGPHVFVVRGVAGIGKSSLAAKACERLKASCNVYWHQVRSWDTRPSVLAGLADFLSAIGRPGLRAILDRGETDKADQVLREDLQGTRSALVFDDAHEAIPEVLDFLRLLKDAIADAPDARAIVLSRRAVPFYDRRDVTIRKIVGEIHLEGLGREDIAALLPADAEQRHLIAVAGKLGGHPLFLELLRSAAPRARAEGTLTDVRRFIEEEIYAELTDAERRMMKSAALYEVPFPREALFVNPSDSHDILLTLTTKSLIRPVGEDTFGVHETLRDFFVAILTPHEREALAPVAADRLVRLAEKAQATKDFVAALNCLSNALELTSARERQAALCEALGDTYERIGDFPAALASYKEARQRTDELETLARLHRKTAAGLQVRGEMAAAVAEVEAGFAALKEQPSVERGWLNFVQCRVAWEREQWAEAREHGEAALGWFESVRDTNGQARTLLELANVEINAQGDPAKAERYLMSALDLSEPAGQPEFRARVHIALANLHANRIGDVGRATRDIEAIEALLDSIADPHVRRSYLFLRAWFALYQCVDFRAAETWFTEALVLAHRIHAPSSLAFAKYGLAHVRYFEGRLDEAREAFEECARELDGQEFYGYAMEARWMVAECCVRLEDLEGFLRIAEAYRDPQRATGVSARPFHARVVEGLDCLVRGDPTGCEAAFAEAVRLIGTRPIAPDATLSAFVHLYYGVALRAMGDDPSGMEHIQTARILLEAGGLKAQLFVIGTAEPSLVEFLHRAYVSSGASTAR